MSLSNPRSLFGIHSIAPYDRSTGEFFGILKVLGDTELNFGATSVDLRGGSNKFPWANETVSLESAFTASVKSYPDFYFEKFAGASLETVAASATGTIDAIANKNGTSVANATTGIDSVAAKTSEEDDLKFGTVIVKAVSATTVDLYYSSDINFKSRGADVNYENDLLKITPSPLTIPDSGATVDVTDYGIEITGGSGIVAMVEDDTAFFKVYPIHGGVSKLTLGQSTIQFPEIGMIIMAQERANEELFEIEAYKAKSEAGIVLPIAEGGFSISSLGVKLLYDSTKDAVALITAVAAA